MFGSYLKRFWNLSTQNINCNFLHFLPRSLFCFSILVGFLGNKGTMAKTVLRRIRFKWLIAAYTIQTKSYCIVITYYLLSLQDYNSTYTTVNNNVLQPTVNIPQYTNDSIIVNVIYFRHFRKAGFL